MIEIINGISDADLDRVYSDSYCTKGGDDENELSPVDHPLVDYWSVYVADNFAGAFLTVRHSKWEVELHSLLMRDFVLWSRDAIREMAETIFSDADVARITAMIQRDLVTVRNTVIKCGFVCEGAKRDAISWHGKMQDMVIYGMTRKDFYEHHWQGNR